MALPKKARNWFDSYIIVYNVNGSSLTIPIVLSPSGVNEGISSTYDSQSVPGRSAPVISYTNTGARSLTFSMRVSMEALPSGYGKDLYKYISALKSLMYPDYSSKIGIIKGPHCKVVLGKLKLDGVCTSFNASYQDIHDKSGQYRIADVELSFLETLEVAPGNVSFISGSSSSSSSQSGNSYIDLNPYLEVSGTDAKGNSGVSQSAPYNYIKGSHTRGHEFYSVDYFPLSGTEVTYTLTLVSNGTIVLDNIKDYMTLIIMLDGTVPVDKVFKLTFKLYMNGKLVDSQTQNRYIKLSMPS